MPPKTVDRIFILNMVLVMEAALLLTATIWSQLSQIELAPSLMLRGRPVLIGIVSGIALAACSTLLFWLSKFKAASWLFAVRELVTKELAPMFATVTLFDILLISGASGFCEEIFFRGVLQDQLGLIGAAIMFGFLHSPSLRHFHYALWAFAAGALLGILYQWTHNLWAPIMAHTVNNVLGLLFLRSLAKPAPASKT